MTINFNSFTSDDLKLVYLTLHNSLMSTPELMDSVFLQELQTYLYTLASADGIDVHTHAHWENWLGKSRL